MAESDNIINEGEEGSDLFLLLEGLGRRRQQRPGAQGLRPGRLFRGALGLVTCAPDIRRRGHRAHRRVAVLSRGNVYMLVNSVPGVAARMLEGLVATLRDRIQADDRPAHPGGTTSPSEPRRSQTGTCTN